MLRNRYRTNQLTVEAKTTSSRINVVIFIVKVRLVDKKLKSHAGRVKVTKLMIQ